MLVDFIIGLGLSLIIAYIAYTKESLNFSGFLGAVIFGTMLYFFGTFIVWSALIVFFISSSILTKLHEKTDKNYSQGRGIKSVISNALIATICSILYYFIQEPLYLVASIASIAASNADTWASEIGILSKGKTYYITNFKIAPKGVSGAISLLGILSSLLGALFISITFVLLYRMVTPLTINNMLSYGFIVTLSGFLGCQIDSLLGALVQAKYKNIQTGMIAESKELPDESIVLISGFSFITNDVVNLLSSLGGSLIAIILIIGGIYAS